MSAIVFGALACMIIAALVAAGIVGREQTWVRWLACAAVAVGTGVVFIALMKSEPGEGVSAAEQLKGSVIGALVVGLPALGYVLLGHALYRRRILAAVATVISLPALAFVSFFGWLIVAGHISCGPDANDCPI
jgi:hypothetical protein